MDNSKDVNKFETLLSVKTSLIFLYLSLTFPIPIIVSSQTRPLALFLLILGFIVIINFTNEFVVTDSKKISFKTSFIARFFGRKSWELYWEELDTIKTYPTSQGGKIQYFLSTKGYKFLVPQRLKNLTEFNSIIVKNTTKKFTKLNYISPLWTYKVLSFCSLIFLLAEMSPFIFFKDYQR